MPVKKIFQRVRRQIKAVVTAPFWYVADLIRYRRQAARAGVPTRLLLLPQIFDRDPASHTFDRHYVYMDRWAFVHVQKKKPASHVDVGSSIRFLSMASTLCLTTFVDIRPVKPDFDNFDAIEGSVLHLPFADNSLPSLSCLHVAEHIGLGRYGDALDPLGTKKACGELARVLAPGGRLYFALPVGRPAVYFNAHRVHEPQTVLKYFSGLQLVSFAGVTDAGRFESAPAIGRYGNFSYACGMFEFTK